MNRTSPLPKQRILHEPYGEQHPYESLPWERQPRDPAAGEVIRLGVRTEKEVWVDTLACVWWQENDSDRNITRAVKNNSDEAYDYWSVNLPPFCGGQTVHYFFDVRSGERRIQSEEFEFDVLTWISIASVESIENIPDTLQIEMSAGDREMPVTMEIKYTGDRKVTLDLKPGKVHKKVVRTFTEQTEIMNGLDIRFASDPFTMEITRGDGHVLLKCNGINLLLNKKKKIIKYKLEFVSPEDEAFYGLGERFNALDQRGCCQINRVFAQYTHQGDKSYIPVPFFISSRGYGFWLATDQWAEFDLAFRKKDQWTVTGMAESSDRSIHYMLFYHASPMEIVRSFTDETGKPCLPPAWVFGLWASSNDWNSQSEVLRQLALCREHQILPTVLVIEAWSDEITFYIWNDAKYTIKPSDQCYEYHDFKFSSDGHWNDPKAMVEELHKAGVKLVLWQIPVLKLAGPQEALDVAQKLQDESYAVANDFVVKRADRSPHLIEPHMPWFPGGKLIDFSNPQAEDWWMDKHAYLLQEMDVDGFKTDGGEHVWDVNAAFSNGVTGRHGINRYPLWYERAYHHLLERCKRKPEGKGDDRVLFSRAGYTGIQQYSCHWAGDEVSTWDAFRATIRAMLNVGLSGVSFIGWDIAGFAGEIPASELYLRATAFSTFCPIMQFHSDGNARRKPSRDRTPWNIQERTGDKEVVPIFRTFTNLRMNLLPYILSQAWQSSQNGIPLMRTLALEYPDDPVCRQYPYEYLFGDGLLVAPVVEEGVNAITVYLPRGKWQDIWSRIIYQGPSTLQMVIPRDRIAVFQRQNSVLALNLGKDQELGSHVGNDTLHYQNLVMRIFPDGDLQEIFYSPKKGVVTHISCAHSNLTEEYILQIPEFDDHLQIELIGLSAEHVMLGQEELDLNERCRDARSDPLWKLFSRGQGTIIQVPENSGIKTLRILY